MPQKTPDTLSHFDAQGQAHMVDVSTKDITSRIATAAAWIKMSPETLAHVTAGTAKKGDVLGIARIAGIQGAKRHQTSSRCVTRWRSQRSRSI